MRLEILGTTPSGKNAVQTTRTGRHYPNERFKSWRSDAIVQLKPQIKGLELPLDKPVSVFIQYWAGDKRKRDVTGICDALWHLLEHMGIVTDDSLLGGYDCELRFKNYGPSEKPRVYIELLEGAQPKGCYTGYDMKGV